jgi:hypothetical protein
MPEQLRAGTSGESGRLTVPQSRPLLQQLVLDTIDTLIGKPSRL